MTRSDEADPRGYIYVSANAVAAQRVCAALEHLAVLRVHTEIILMSRLVALSGRVRSPPKSRRHDAPLEATTMVSFQRAVELERSDRR